MCRTLWKKTSGLETNKSKVCSCFGYHFFDCTDHDFLLIFQQLIPAQGSETHRARLKVVIGSFTFHCWHQVWYILQVLQSIAYSKYIYIYTWISWIHASKIPQSNTSLFMKWHHFVSFLARILSYQNSSTLETSQIPLTLRPPPYESHQKLCFSSRGRQRNFPGIFLYQTGWCIIHPSIHPSIWQTTHSLTHQKKPLLFFGGFFSRTPFWNQYVDQRGSCSHYFLWKKCTILKGRVV